MDAELTKLAEACERAATYYDTHACVASSRASRLDYKAIADTLRAHSCAIRAGRVTVNEGGENGGA